MPRYYTYKKDVPLGPGQSLGFTTGLGYYARGGVRGIGANAPASPETPRRMAPDLIGRPGGPQPPEPNIAELRKRFAGTRKRRPIDPGFAATPRIRKALSEAGWTPRAKRRPRPV